MMRWRRWIAAFSYKDNTTKKTDIAEPLAEAHTENE